MNSPNQNEENPSVNLREKNKNKSHKDLNSYYSRHRNWKKRGRE